MILPTTVKKSDWGKGCGVQWMPIRTIAFVDSNDVAQNISVETLAPRRPSRSSLHHVSNGSAMVLGVDRGVPD